MDILDILHKPPQPFIGLFFNFSAIVEMPLANPGQ